MRFVKIISAVALVVTALTACSVFGESDEERAQRLLDKDAAIVVMLAEDVTQQQKADIEARLRALPDVTEVVFEDRQHNYDSLKKGLGDDDERLLDDLDPETFPESFRAKMTDQAAVQKFRDSTAKSELRAVAGVSEVVIPCTTVAECRENVIKRNTPKSPG